MTSPSIRRALQSWQTIALMVLVAGISWFSYALFLQQSEGEGRGGALTSRASRCSGDAREYAVANFSLQYFSTGCAALSGGLVIDALGAVDSYSKNLQYFGLPKLNANTVILLVPGESRWRLLGGPGSDRRLLAPVGPRSSGDLRDPTAVGAPIAAAMLEEAAPGLRKQDRDGLAEALAIAASPDSVPDSDNAPLSYRLLLTTGKWQEIRRALNGCGSRRCSLTGVSASAQ